MEKLIVLTKTRISNSIIETPFTDAEIKAALELSLSAFNCQPTFTNISNEDAENLEQLADILVTYAAHILFIKSVIIETKKEAADRSFDYPQSGKSQMFENIARLTFDNWFRQVVEMKKDPKFIDEFSDPE